MGIDDIAKDAPNGSEPGNPRLHPRNAPHSVGTDEMLTSVDAPEDGGVPEGEKAKSPMGSANLLPDEPALTKPPKDFGVKSKVDVQEAAGIGGLLSFLGGIL